MALTLLSDRRHLGKANFLRPMLSPPVSDGPKKSVPPKYCVPFELFILRLGIIQRVMQPTALFSIQRRIDNQGCYRREVTQLQQVHRYFKIPIELTNFALEIT